jgi:hypothetical protein
MRTMRGVGAVNVGTMSVVSAISATSTIDYTSPYYNINYLYFEKQKNSIKS